MAHISRSVWLIVATTLAVTAATPSRAEAEPTGIVVVTGKIGTHEIAIIESAIKTALRRASWSMSAQAFTPKEAQSILRCLADDKPWPCLGPLMQPKGVDRIVVAEVNPQPDSASKLVITGQFAEAGDGSAAVQQQRCDGCDDARLAATAQRLTEALLTDMVSRKETVLELQTVPPGATVRLDDQPLGTTSASGQLKHATLPGPHKLTVQHPGFASQDRDLDLAVAKTTHVDVQLTPVEATPTPSAKRSLLLPLGVTGAGAAAVAIGVTLQLTADAPPLGKQQDKYIVSTPGIVLMVGGGAVIGVGVYLWLRSRNAAAPAAMPVAAVIDRGGLIGWTGRF